MKGFLIGVLLTILVIGGGGGYLYMTKFRGQAQDAAMAPAPAAMPEAAPTPPPATAEAPAVAAAPTPAAGQPLARADHGNISGVSLAVTELKRTSGDTVSLKFTITNTGADTDYYMSRGQVCALELVDAANKKKYLVVRDSEDKCLSTDETDYVKPGNSAHVWAKFPAPPPDVTKISVVVPDYTPMDDLPISQ